MIRSYSLFFKNQFIVSCKNLSKLENSLLDEKVVPSQGIFGNKPNLIL